MFSPTQKPQKYFWLHKLDTQKDADFNLFFFTGDEKKKEKHNTKTKLIGPSLHREND